MTLSLRDTTQFLNVPRDAQWMLEEEGGRLKIDLL